MVELPQQAQQLALILFGQGIELVGKQRVVSRHHLIMDPPALIGQKKAIEASIWPPLQQTTAFHLVQQLAHVALGDQERVGELLLADAFVGTNFG